MERTIVIVVMLVSVLFYEQKRVFGTQMNKRVKAGESTTLFCDCVLPLGSHIAWWRNCSHEHQPSLLIEAGNLFTGMFPRFSFVFNSSSNSYDLHITNVSVSDEGLYYGAIKDRKAHDVHSIISCEYQYGNRSTHLSVLEPRFNTSTPPVSDLCWTLLFSVCPVCVLFSLLSSICVYCFCQRKTIVPATTQSEIRHNESEDEVCYASLNTLSMLKRKTLQNSDFCIYTEVGIKRT